MYTGVPAITGKQLIKLLQRDGGVIGRRATHGVTLTRAFSQRTRVTFVPNTRSSPDTGTLMAILGNKQTGLGRAGLLALLNKYGL